MLSLETGPEEDPDPDLNSLLGLEEHPVWLRGTEEVETQKRIDILTLDVPARKYISVHEVFLVRPPCPCRRPPLTFTGVVVNFICRDSSLSILSFSLHNSQLFL